MELVNYLLKRLSRYVMIIFVMILPLIVEIIISTIMNIKEVSFGILIILIGYIVLFFIQHVIAAWKYMKAHNLPAEEAWKKTSWLSSDKCEE